LVAEGLAAAAFVVAILAEMLHARRIRRVALLAFGPRGRASMFARVAPLLRSASCAAVAWGLWTLMELPPKKHVANEAAEGEERHIVLVLDVSPSMRLEDAGVDGVLSRMKRASELMESFFRRVSVQQFRISVIAVYNGAKPVVVDTRDVDVVRNILNDLPMHFAFRSGETDLFAGIREAAKIAKPWNPRSTTLILLSDGDTVPARGMPELPVSISNVVVVGVGDPRAGKFIDGRRSRQDVSMLRQIALRLGGDYHNGNEKHLSTSLLQKLTRTAEKSQFEKLTKREYALIASGAGAALLALLPWLLHLFGSSWRPGVPRRPSGAAPAPPASVPAPSSASTSTSTSAFAGQGAASRAGGAAGPVAGSGVAKGGRRGEARL